MPQGPTPERVNSAARWKALQAYRVLESIATPEATNEHGPATAWLYPPQLAVLAILCTLELPGREAADVDVKLIQPRLIAVKRELDLELQLILRDGLTADPAVRTHSRSAPGTIGSSVWQLSIANDFAGFRAKRRLVRHIEVSRIRQDVAKPNARRPGRLLASPWKPDGRRGQFTRLLRLRDIALAWPWFDCTRLNHRLK
jgi:hypothetical protein